MSSPTPPPRSTPTAALRRPKPPGDLPASTCALPRTCSSPSTDANTTHQSLKAAPVSRLGRPFSLLATGGVGFCPASTHPIRRTEGGKGGVRGGQLNEILVSKGPRLRMRLRLGVSAQGQKTYLTPQRLGSCCAVRSRNLPRSAIRIRCRPLHRPFLLPDPQPHPIILITRVDTRATDIMVMTGKRSGRTRRSCGLSERRHLDKARSLVRYLVGNGGDTMHNMDV